MEFMIAVVGLVVLSIPIIAVVALVRTSRLRSGMDERFLYQLDKIRALESQVATLRQRPGEDFGTARRRSELPPSLRFPLRTRGCRAIRHQRTADCPVILRDQRLILPVSGLSPSPSQRSRHRTATIRTFIAASRRSRGCGTHAGSVHPPGAFISCGAGNRTCTFFRAPQSALRPNRATVSAARSHRAHAWRAPSLSVAA